ncbi:class F sortase [Streptomyces sp. NPDC014894]|uniref:class F sortase n=1 Tax=Streptomyces sp. NPDC014894 TaxID=3364931 RepID=UPI0036FF9C06
MTLCAVSSLVSGIVWASGDSPATAPAARGSDAAGGAPPPSSRAPHRPPENVRPPRAPLSPSRPVKLIIPAIMIEAPVLGVGLDAEDRLDAPPLSKPKVVGWYQDGPSPGDAGTSLIVGHRDTRTGAAIFLNLNALKPGDAVKIVRADRRTAVFTVDAVKTYKKSEFPDDKVYGAAKRPELRLLTCGGRFDKKTGYSANVVVFAHRTALRNMA